MYASGRWQIKTSEGDQGEFDLVITATGILHHPVYPDIVGVKAFNGVAFHSSRWDHSVSLTGKRVGIDRHGFDGRTRFCRRLSMTWTRSRCSSGPRNGSCRNQIRKFQKRRG